MPLEHGADGRRRCSCCQGELQDFKEHERVVEDIVPATTRVTCYRTQSGYCRKCRKRVEARHPQQPPPADLPQAQLGLNALCVAATLKHDAGLPYRKVTRVLKDLCKLDVSPGALPKQMRRMGAWLAGPYAQIKAGLRQSDVVHCDETGGRIDGDNHWLWAVTDPRHTLYHMDKHRSGAVVRSLLGEEFAGHLVSDFLPAYDQLPYKTQKCIPHLLRDLERTREKNPAFAAHRFSRRLKRLCKDMLRLKRRWEELDDNTYSMRTSRIQDRLEQLGKTVSNEKDVKRLAKRLRKHAKAITAFLLVKNLPGDNNAAERAIRPAVIIRKISGGHRGRSTADASMVIMSVLRTARQQGRHLIDTIKQLVQAHLAGQPVNLLTSTSG